MAKYLIEFPEGREYFPDFLPTDDFYSGIYIAPEHIKAWRCEFHTLPMEEMSLIEEMAELTKAISKLYRKNNSSIADECKAAVIEEMAHVIISIKGLAYYLGISPEDIQDEIEKKWPAAYEPEKGECKDCYWSMKEQHNDVVTVLRCTARCNTACDYCGPCEGFAKKGGE